MTCNLQNRLDPSDRWRVRTWMRIQLTELQKWGCTVSTETDPKMERRGVTVEDSRDG